MERLAGWTALPIYSPWSGQLGKGVLAGQCEFNAFHAVHAAQMVIAILRGTKPADIPILHEPEPYLIYDDRLLVKYGIAEKRLPQDSVVINRPQSYLAQYRALLLPSAAVLSVLVGVILLLAYLLRMKQRSERLLRQEKVVLAHERELERRSELSRRMEAIGRMAGGITHDVNNILGGISACAQLALPEIPRDNPAHEDISRILDATARGKALMKQIRMTDSTKTREAQPELCSVSKLLRECAGLLQPQIPPSVTLRISDGCPQACIRAVSGEMHQILLNLCLNALQAMPDGGELCLSSSLGDPEKQNSEGKVSGNFVRIDVLDTGKGIPEDLLERIFDPFFTTKQQSGGTGLGLSQVHSLVQRNHGAVTVANRPGGGSVFSVFIPCVAPDGSAAVPGSRQPVDSADTCADGKAASPATRPAPPAADPVHPDQRAPVALVIDDDPTIRYLLEKKLRAMGISAVLSSDAENARKLCDGGMRPDILITDQRLPGMQGTQFARWFRGSFPQVPVLFCSSAADAGLADVAAAIGGARVLAKPFPPERLEELVLSLLRPGA